MKTIEINGKKFKKVLQQPITKNQLIIDYYYTYWSDKKGTFKCDLNSELTIQVFLTLLKKTKEYSSFSECWDSIIDGLSEYGMSEKDIIENISIDWQGSKYYDIKSLFKGYLTTPDDKEFIRVDDVEFRLIDNNKVYKLEEI